MTPPDEPDRSVLVEAVAGAYREHDHRGVRSHPAWHDLDGEGRREAFEVACALRSLEAALDREGLSSTARTVLARVRASADIG